MESKIKTKSHLWVGIALVSAITISTSYSLVTFAQSTMNSKKDVIITEPQKLAELNFEEEAVHKATDEMIFPVAMTADQAEPFIKLAIDAFKAQGIKLPEDDYWISTKYIDNGSKDVQVDWYPNSFDGIGPMDMINDKVYVVYFTNTNLINGTGDIANLQILEKGDIESASSSIN